MAAAVSTEFVARVSWPMTLGKPVYLVRTWTQYGAEHHWTTDEHAALAWRFADRTSVHEAYETFARSRTHTTPVLEVLEVPAMVNG